MAGIYSPQDFQVNPKALTQALVAAAQAHGVAFHFGQPVVAFGTEPVQDGGTEGQRCTTVETPAQSFTANAVVLTSGLGTTPLTHHLQQPTAIGPVLGQGLRLHLTHPPGFGRLSAVVNGNDIHLVPLGQATTGWGPPSNFPPIVTSPIA
ncbi:MAG: FAD-dependent oxidoreductase [Leptolyngbyaceae cyanobacterium SM2_3_12]|nr:FAD-dependent oxidoreductase [Leptolyngbyaceae cyanobacterium SM2_3_12]